MEDSKPSRTSSNIMYIGDQLGAGRVTSYDKRYDEEEGREVEVWVLEGGEFVRCGDLVEIRTAGRPQA